jgi:cell division protein FtsQ
MNPTLDARLMNMTANVMFIAFALLCLSAAFNWASRHPIFALRGISVFGEINHNNAVTLRANVAARLTNNFIGVDLASARQAFESVPWVRKAVVQREFPNRLKVTLEEHQAVAYWGLEGESRLINSFGEVFEANLGEVEQDDLPRLDGPQDQSALVLSMYQRLKPFWSRMDVSITELTLSRRGGWRVEVDNGALVELGGGSPEEVVARVQGFLQTLSQVATRYGRGVNALEYADLRYREGYALKLRGVSTVLPEIKKN